MAPRSVPVQFVTPGSCPVGCGPLGDRASLQTWRGRPAANVLAPVRQQSGWSGHVCGVSGWFVDSELICSSVYILTGAWSCSISFTLDKVILLVTCRHQFVANHVRTSIGSRTTTDRRSVRLYDFDLIPVSVYVTQALTPSCGKLRTSRVPTGGASSERRCKLCVPCSCLVSPYRRGCARDSRE